MKTRVKILISVILIVVAAVAVGGFLFFENKNKTQKDVVLPEITKFKEERAAGQTKKPSDDQKERFDSKLGYTLFYPKGWTVDDSQKEFPVEFINEPSGKASVAIQTFEDPRLKTTDTREQALNDAKDAFNQDKTYTLKIFEWENENKKSESNSYFAAGSFVKEDKPWRFMEIMTFSSGGTVFVFRANAIGTEASTYGPIAEEILFSFIPTKNLEKDLEKEAPEK